MRAVVVGGGIAGLVAAWELSRRGQQVTVLEAGQEFGGALASRTLAGLTLNAGAEAFASATPAVFELLDDLGLRGHVVAPRQGESFILNLRGAFRSPRNSFLGIPAHPQASDVVPILGQEAAERAAAEATLDAQMGYRPGVSLGEYVAARMGPAVRDLLVEPVVGGVHSTHPDLLELDSIAPHLHAAVLKHGSLQRAVVAIRQNQAPSGAAVAGLVPGMHLLPATLVDRLTGAGQNVRTGAGVVEVTAPKSGGWVVRTAEGEHACDQVVLATPAEVSRQLLAGVPHVSESIPVVPRSSVVLAIMVVHDERLDAAPRANGVLVAAHTPGIVAKALTHVTAKWDHVARAAEASAPGQHRHVLRLSYGRSGKNVPTRAEVPDLALNDARRLLGIHLEREAVAAIDQVRWDQTMTQARPGHRTALHEVTGRLAAHPGLALAGAWVAGTGIAAITSHSRRVAAHLAGDIVSHPITAEPRYTPGTHGLSA